MLSMNKDSVISSFPNCIHFISFSYLIALARTSDTMLERGSERGHPCLVPNLRKKVSSFSPLSITYYVSCKVFVDILYEVEEVPLYSHLNERFFSFSSRMGVGSSSSEFQVSDCFSCQMLFHIY